MPSCTVPIFSKIVVTLLRHPAGHVVICQDIGIAIATVPTEMWPALHNQIASAAGADHQRRVHHRQAQRRSR